LALVDTSRSVFGLNALVDEVSIIGHVSWSTVVLSWDQVSSVVPDADIDFAVALVFDSLADTLSPLILLDLGSFSLDWVAELFSEKWTFFVSIGINPVALVNGLATLLILALEAWISFLRDFTSVTGWDLPLAPSLNWSSWFVAWASPLAPFIVPCWSTSAAFHISWHVMFDTGLLPIASWFDACLNIHLVASFFAFRGNGHCGWEALAIDWHVILANVLAVLVVPNWSTNLAEVLWHHGWARSTSRWLVRLPIAVWFNASSFSRLIASFFTFNSNSSWSWKALTIDWLSDWRLGWINWW
jgi:hypothetical protein